MKFYIYVLKSELNKSYYVGSTENINDRVKLHNSWLVQSTKRYIPWDLVYREEFPNLSRARKRELKIKSWKKRAAIEKLISNAAMV